MLRLVPPSYRQSCDGAVLVELAADRPTRVRNTLAYRVAHWPVWAFAFFLLPGPVTFTVFTHGADASVAVWLVVVLAGTAISGFLGRLPGTEPAPYVLLYGEDTPNPLHRRVCYTVAWCAALTYAALNLLSVGGAALTGVWRSTQIYQWGYAPAALVVLALGLMGRLPRARPSTKGEGLERRHFYGVVWTVTVAQLILLAMWKTLPVTPQTNVAKAVVYGAALAGVGWLARRGWLPRTRPILPGTRAAAD